MWIDEDSGPAAEILHQRILTAARSRPIVAYELCTPRTDDVAGFVELALETEELSHGWVGYWASADHRENGIAPVVVVACAPSSESAQLRARVGIAPHADVRMPLPFAGRVVVEFDFNGTCVIVLDRSGARAAEELTVCRVSDPEPFLRGWETIATGQL